MRANLKDIEIRKIKPEDISAVADLWYEASVEAHDFIPADYWLENRSLMESRYLPMSETWVITFRKELAGFVSLMDDYLAAIFIRPDLQGRGFGRMLLDYSKKLKDSLSLKVYCKNRKSIDFYRKNGFSVISESTDEDTGEAEFLMSWNSLKE